MTPIGSATTAGANSPGNGQLFHRGDTGPLGPQIADSGVDATGGTLLPRRCSRRDRFDQLVHAAVENPAQVRTNAIPAHSWVRCGSAATRRVPAEVYACPAGTSALLACPEGGHPMRRRPGHAARPGCASRPARTAVPAASPTGPPEDRSSAGAIAGQVARRSTPAGGRWPEARPDTRSRAQCGYQWCASPTPAGSRGMAKDAVTCCPAGTSMWRSYSPCRAFSPGWRLWCGCWFPVHPTPPIEPVRRPNRVRPASSGLVDGWSPGLPDAAGVSTYAGVEVIAAQYLTH
jgi:hypothetical protein